MRSAYREIGFAAEVVPFIDDVADALHRADLVVARSGAMTVTDIALAARPAIFVPYPFHNDRQQVHNARVIEKRGGAIIVRDDDQLAPNLARELEALIRNPARLDEMGCARIRRRIRTRLAHRANLFRSLAEQAAA